MIQEGDGYRPPQLTGLEVKTELPWPPTGVSTYVLLPSEAPADISAYEYTSHSPLLSDAGKCRFSEKHRLPSGRSKGSCMEVVWTAAVDWYST